MSPGAAGRLQDWEQIFAGYRATTDWPASFFLDELLARYPSAKVVLTVREPDKWYRSMYDTVFQFPQVGFAEAPAESDGACEQASC